MNVTYGVPGVCVGDNTGLTEGMLAIQDFRVGEYVKTDGTGEKLLLEPGICLVQVIEFSQVTRLGVAEVFPAFCH